MSKHFDAIFIHTCTVERATEVQSGSGEMELTYTTLATGVACRLVRKLERFAAEGSSKENIKSEMLLVKATSDVEAGDRVTAFAWTLTGNSYNVGTYEVLNRLQRNTTRAHHVSLELEQIG